jgi:hypothetical protein
MFKNILAAVIGIVLGLALLILIVAVSGQKPG